jgi:hypothetical protein
MTSARPLLLAAGLYGASSLALPPLPPPPSLAPGSLSSSVGDRNRAVTSVSGPLDLSHLAAVTSASGQQQRAAAAHSFFQLHKASQGWLSSSGNNLQ